MEIVGFIALALIALAVGAVGLLHFFSESMRPNGDGNPFPGCLTMLASVIGVGALIWWQF